VIIAVAGAVATAVATAVFSPSTIKSLWGSDEDAAPDSSARSSASQSQGNGPTASSSASEGPVELKTIQSDLGAITLRVPREWGNKRAAWNLTFVPSPRPGQQSGEVSPGDGLVSASTSGVSNDSFYGSEFVGFVASSAAAEDLRTAGRSRGPLTEYLYDLVRSAHYTDDGCKLTDEGELDVEGYVAVYRTYAECAGFSDSHLWDMYGLSEDGRVMVSAGLGSSHLSLEQQREVLDSWAVAPERLPAGPGYRRDDAVELPLPPWLPTS
jgi:hypothetical protein